MPITEDVIIQQRKNLARLIRQSEDELVREYNRVGLSTIEQNELEERDLPTEIWNRKQPKKSTPSRGCYREIRKSR